MGEPGYAAMGAGTGRGFAIRPYRDDDHRAIADLFHSAVHAIADDLYSPSQKQAWAPPPDYPHWQQRLARTRPWVAVAGQEIAGFIELEADGHIDCLYVHPDHQRKGVAGDLLDYVVDLARERGLTRLYTEASRVARPVFERRGFFLQTEHHVSRRGQTLINYTMVFTLPPG